MGAFDDLIPGAKPKAQDFGAFTDLVPPEQGDFTRGAKVAFGQLAPIAKGVVGLVGATAEQAFGEGGLATGVKNWGLRGFTEGMQRLEPLQRETDDVTVAWQRAKDGDLGALLDWAQYGLGYAVGQAGEAVGAALLGAGAGMAMAPEVAPVAGAAGAVTGLVAKGAVRQTAVGLIERAVAKEANRIVAEGGGRIAAQEAVTIATKNIAREIGASGALLTLGTGQELGSIYPEAEAEAIKRGEQLDGADLARVWASGLAAGGVEGLTDRLGIQAAMGRVRVPGAQTRLGQAGLMGVGGAALEGATEAAQTGIERFGAQKDILSPEGLHEIVNASALGALGGGAIGGAIGAVQGPAGQRARSNAAFEAIGAAKSADEAIAAFEQTYEEITVPPEFDANGAMNRLEAQRQRDEQALRQFGPQVSRETSGSTVTSPDVQVRDAEQAWAEVLPGLPRHVYAQLAQDQSIDARATSEGQRALLREHLSAPGQDPQAALREVFGPDLANAPRRLQQATGGSLDVPSMPSRASQAGGSTSIGPAEPFADRLLSLRDLIADSRNRQQVRDTLGPVALNDLMYYLSAADNASLPGVTSDRMLQVAEEILNRAQIQREERPGIGGKPAQAAIDAAAAPAQIPLDTAPTGRIRVDADGVAVQEIGADVISAADRERARAEGRGQGMTGSFPQGFPDRPGVLVGEGTLSEAVFPKVEQKLLPGPSADERGQTRPSADERGPETVDSGAHEAAASPTNEKTATKEQILGGNAELGHTTLPGLDISVENPAGSERVDLKNDPPQWRNTMKDHYGYIRGSTSIDGEHMDVFMREGTATSWQGTVFVVDQIDPKTGKPDEHKVMLGYDSVDEAKEAYRRNYSKDWKGMGGISAMPYDTFKAWVFDKEATSRPLIPPMRERAQAMRPNPQDAIADDGLRLGDARADMKAPPAPDRWNTAPADQRRTWLRAVGRTDLADKAGVANWTWDKLSMNLRARLPRVMKEGAPDAQAVRGDARQVREGRQGGQPGVQRGPEQGRGDLQRPPQEQPGAAGPVREGAAEGQAPVEQLSIDDTVYSKTGGEKGVLRRGDVDGNVMVLWDGQSRPSAFPRNQITKEKPDDGRPATPANRPGDEGDRQRPRQEEPQEATAPRDQARQEEGLPADEITRLRTEPAAQRWGLGRSADNSLTGEGRRRALQAIGAPMKGNLARGDRASVRWEYLTADERAKLRALFASGWNPDEGEAAATPTPETAATEGAQDGLQEEGQGRRREEVAAPAGETPADPFTRFDGITLERKVSIAGTGEVATIRFDAGKALRDLAAREKAITRLRACVLRGGS